MFLTAVGALLNIAELFMMAMGLAVVMLVSLVLAFYSARNLEVHEEMPDLVPVGEPFEVRLRVVAEGSENEPRYDVVLSLPDGIEYLGLGGQSLITQDAASRFRLVAICRGAHVIGVPAVTVQDPLGLFEIRVKTGREHVICAWPRPISPAAQVEPVAADVDSGMREGGRRGINGTSIYSVRPWVPGDAARHVHWPSTARLGKLAVMEFEADASDDLVIILDSWQGEKAEGTQAFETACGVVSHLLHSSWAERQRVGAVIDSRVLVSPVGQMSQRQKREALAALASVKPSEARPLGDVVRGWGPWLSGAGAVVFVTTRWDTEFQEQLGALRALTNRLQVMLITEPDLPGPRKGRQPVESAMEGVEVSVITSDELVGT